MTEKQRQFNRKEAQMRTQKKGDDGPYCLSFLRLPYVPLGG